MEGHIQAQCQPCRWGRKYGRFCCAGNQRSLRGPHAGCWMLQPPHAQSCLGLLHLPPFTMKPLPLTLLVCLALAAGCTGVPVEWGIGTCSWARLNLTASDCSVRQVDARSNELYAKMDSNLTSGSLANCLPPCLPHTQQAGVLCSSRAPARASRAVRRGPAGSFRRCLQGWLLGRRRRGTVTYLFQAAIPLLSSGFAL